MDLEGYVFTYSVMHLEWFGIVLEVTTRAFHFHFVSVFCASSAEFSIRTKSKGARDELGCVCVLWHKKFVVINFRPLPAMASLLSSSLSLFRQWTTSASGLASSTRTFSASASCSKYKLKTHSGTKKRWKSLPNGTFKRVSLDPTRIRALDINWNFATLLLGQGRQGAFEYGERPRSRQQFGTNGLQHPNPNSHPKKAHALCVRFAETFFVIFRQRSNRCAVETWRLQRGRTVHPAIV